MHNTGRDVVRAAGSIVPGLATNRHLDLSLEDRAPLGFVTVRGDLYVFQDLEEDQLSMLCYRRILIPQLRPGARRLCIRASLALSLFPAPDRQATIITTKNMSQVTWKAHFGRCYGYD